MKYFLRKADIDDTNELFEWRNEKTTRLFSFDSNPINAEVHKQWLKTILDSDDHQLYILCDTRSNNKYGQVRLDIYQSDALISFSISKEFRGNGLGIKILNLAITEAENNYNIKRLIAKVKNENIASRKIFEKLEFKSEKQDYYVSYTKYLGRDL